MKPSDEHEDLLAAVVRGSGTSASPTAAPSSPSSPGTALLLLELCCFGIAALNLAALSWLGFKAAAAALGVLWGSSFLGLVGVLLDSKARLAAPPWVWLYFHLCTLSIFVVPTVVIAIKPAVPSIID